MSKTSLNKLPELVQNIEKELNELFVERNAPIHGLILSTLSRTNILLLGTPGTAKSYLINRWNQHIVGSYFFSWLLTRFSTPEELFGTVSLKGLEKDEYYRTITGKLPEANTAFIDEIFKASSGILNSLLSIMNERIFYNNGKALKIPLITLAGASNEVPEKEDGLDAVYDRFLLKYNVTMIREDSNFKKMLENNAIMSAPKYTITLDQILQAQEEIKKVAYTEEVIENLVKVRTELHNKAFMISDRAFKLMSDIIKAEAWLHGRSECSVDDLEILQHTCWQDPDRIRDVQLLILDVISPEKYRVQKVYNDSLDIITEFWKTKDSKKKNDQAIEVTTKIKEAKNQINKFKLELQRQNKDITEVEKMEDALNEKMKEIYVRALGITMGGKT